MLDFQGSTYKYWHVPYNRTRASWTVFFLGLLLTDASSMTCAGHHEEAPCLTHVMSPKRKFCLRLFSENSELDVRAAIPPELFSAVFFTIIMINSNLQLSGGRRLESPSVVRRRAGGGARCFWLQDAARSPESPKGGWSRLLPGEAAAKNTGKEEPTRSG